MVQAGTVEPTHVAREALLHIQKHLTAFSSDGVEIRQRIQIPSHRVAPLRYRQPSALALGWRKIYTR